MYKIGSLRSSKVESAESVESAVVPVLQLLPTSPAGLKAKWKSKTFTGSTLTTMTMMVISQTRKMIRTKDWW